jgi:hypothetical protein
MAKNGETTLAKSAESSQVTKRSEEWKTALGDHAQEVGRSNLNLI